MAVEPPRILRQAWASVADYEAYSADYDRYGTAMWELGEDGLKRHLPMPENFPLKRA